MTRPSQLVVVTGTATDVGKTWVGAAWLSTLTSRAARKPVQSFVAGERTDADVLAAASGERAVDVCPRLRWYEVPMAPPMAAAVLGRPEFAVADLVDELQWPDARVDVGVVEGVGGPRSPLASDGDTVDLARALDPDRVLLVADAGLGTINAVRLSAAPFADYHPVTVFLNRYNPRDELHMRNREWLAKRDGFQVVTTVDAL